MIQVHIEAAVLDAAAVLDYARKAGGFREEELRGVTPTLVSRMFLGGYGVTPTPQDYGVRVVDSTATGTVNASGHVELVQLDLVAEVIDEAKVMAFAVERHQALGLSRFGMPKTPEDAVLMALLLNVRDPSAAGLEVVCCESDPVPEDLAGLAASVDGIDESELRGGLGNMIRRLAERYREGHVMGVVIEQLDTVEWLAKRTARLARQMAVNAKRQPWFLRPDAHWDESVGPEYDRQRAEVKAFLECALRGATMVELVKLAQFAARETKAVPAPYAWEPEEVAR